MGLLSDRYFKTNSRLNLFVTTSFCGCPEDLLKVLSCNETIEEMKLDGNKNIDQEILDEIDQELTYESSSSEGEDAEDESDEESASSYCSSEEAESASSKDSDAGFKTTSIVWFGFVGDRKISVIFRVSYPTKEIVISYFPSASSSIKNLPSKSVS